MNQFVDVPSRILQMELLQHDFVPDVQTPYLLGAMLRDAFHDIIIHVALGLLPVHHVQQIETVLVAEQETVRQRHDFMAVPVLRVTPDQLDRRTVVQFPIHKLIKTAFRRHTIRIQVCQVQNPEIPHNISFTILHHRIWNAHGVHVADKIAMRFYAVIMEQAGIA